MRALLLLLLIAVFSSSSPPGQACGKGDTAVDTASIGRGSLPGS
jgi:hypothetical protein